MLVALMLSTGLECDRQRLVAALKDRPLLGRALAANFVVIPLIALAFVRIFRVEGAVAIGILLMAIAPGAPFLTRSGGSKPGGSQGLAISLAFIMPALSILTIPITAGLVLPPDANAHLPWVSFVIKLCVLQLLPLLIGLFAADRAPAVVPKAVPVLGLVLIGAIGVVLWHLGPVLVRSFLSVHGSHGIWAMLAIVAACLGVGWLFGGRRREDRRTLTIATGVRNFGLCTLIAATSFPNTLVAASVMTYFIVQFVATFGVRIYFQHANVSAHDTA